VDVPVVGTVWWAAPAPASVVKENDVMSEGDLSTTATSFPYLSHFEEEEEEEEENSQCACGADVCDLVSATN